MSSSWEIKSSLSKISRNLLIKASIAWDHPCFLFTLTTIFILHVSNLVNHKDYLALELYSLLPMGYCIWVVFASAQQDYI